MGRTSNFSRQTPRQTSAPTLNRLTLALADACRARLLAEKWLLVPSLRVGHQWIDAVARAGQPAVNVRLKTIKSLALELSGATARPDIAGIIEIARLLAKHHDEDGYLFSLPASLPLAQTVFASLRELRLAGFDDLPAKTSEVPAKQRELRALLRESHDDYPNALRLAAKAAAALQVHLLIPADLEFSALETQLLESFPSRTLLPVDEKSDTAPAVIRAIGEINEVRAVLRRVLAGGIAFDQVEILHTDAGTYLPLLFEETERLGVAVTFSEGVPTRFSRPGRALAAWLAWQREDFPQAVLVQMLGDGLLEWPGEIAHTRLASRLRALGIGFGRRRYASALHDQIAALEQALPERDEDGDPRARCRERALEELRWLKAGLETLLADASETLAGARKFLRERVHCVTEMDNFARHALLERIEVFERCLGDEPLPGLDIAAWLAALPDKIRVCGTAPMPGHLHVAGIGNGGHSGRPHTFILGLDSGRWANVARQDPVLLDAERKRLGMETSDQRRERDRRAFDCLLARLPGNVTLCYCARNLADDSEMFPAEPIKELPAAESFAPSAVNEALDEADAWRAMPANTEIVAKRFPNLARGIIAARARAGEAFSEFDGFVPQAGARDGVWSASRLQTLGACPLRFFFRYVLAVEPPEELEMDPDRWLRPSDFGLLLHEVFYRYVREGGDIEAVLAERVAAWRENIPPPSESVFRREERRLQRAARTFVGMEIRGRPRFVEAAIGLPSRDRPGELDRAEPVAIELPDGNRIAMRGYIDRIDEVGPNRFAIWDYKTFGAGKYSRSDFDQGRILQHALYLAMTEVCLREKFGPGAVVESFGFLFPTEQGRGETIKWAPEELAGGLDIVAKLCELRARGAFLATTNVKDCEHCDYRSCCGDLRALAEASATKLYHPGNSTLAPLRELRPKKT